MLDMVALFAYVLSWGPFAWGFVRGVSRSAYRRGFALGERVDTLKEEVYVDEDDE